MIKTPPEWAGFGERNDREITAVATTQVNKKKIGQVNRRKALMAVARGMFSLPATAQITFAGGNRRKVGRVPDRG